MGKCDALLQCADHNIRSDDNCDSTLLQPKFFVIRALEGMMMEEVEWDMLCEVHKGVQDGRSEDSVVKAMKELEKSNDKRQGVAKFGMGRAGWAIEVS